MAIPEGFHHDVVTNVLDNNLSLPENNKGGVLAVKDSDALIDDVLGGVLVTDVTRQGLVALIKKHAGNMVPVLEELLRIEFRLGNCLPILDKDGAMRRAFGEKEFKAFLRRMDPAKIFAVLEKQAPESSLAIAAAERLGMGHMEILRHAIDQAAERAGCIADIQALIAEIRPRIEAEIDEEMEMPIAERIAKKGY